MTLISRLVAVSVFAVLVAASSPVALSQAAQESIDERQELSLLEKAEKGDAQSQVMLALVYEFGLSGVAKSGVADTATTDALLQLCAACYLDDVHQGSRLTIEQIAAAK